MIIIPIGTLWMLLAVWLAVVACAFAFGWYACLYSRAERRQVDQAVRRHPSTRYQPGHLPRPGRLPLDTYLIASEIRQPDPSRWWPALERHERADTAPFSHVETSNWEARIKRDTDAWLHERGWLP